MTRTEEQTALAESVRAHIERSFPFGRRREVTESGEGWDRAHWRELASDLGVVGLLIEERVGGAGGSLADAVVVAEELGRGLVPGPFVVSSVAAALLLSLAGRSDLELLLGRIADGSAVVVPTAVGPLSELDLAQVPSVVGRDGGGWLLDGVVEVVEAGPWATHLLVAAALDGADLVADPGLFLVPLPYAGVELTSYPMVHGGRAATVSLRGVELPGDALVLRGDDLARAWGRADDEAMLVRCAYALGVMAASVVDTFAHVTDRRQFGQPLSSFQAVQHRAVDMAIDVEMARAAISSAVGSADPAAVSAAAVVVKDAARRVGQGAIQLFGGMGMSLETAVSHRFRALTVFEHDGGSSDVHARRLAELVDTGNDLATSASASSGGADADGGEFRAEVRAFLDANLTDELRRAGRGMTSVYTDHDSSVEWQQVLNGHGWGAPGWPEDHGGCGWTPQQRYIYQEESLRAGAPPAPLGIQMCGPAVIQFGTPEQKARFLPAMLSTEHLWCQGYSEPDAGSDLASLRMAAVRDGDDLVVTGTKVWTTHAHQSNWIFTLVRTSTQDRPQKGITFLLIDMDSRGVTVTPLVSLTGEHIQNEVHFDQVRVPVSNVLGEIDQGWTVAKYLLDFERGGTAYGPEIRVMVEALETDLRQARARHPERAVLDDPVFATKLARARAHLEALSTYEVAAMASGATAVSASMMKILGTELRQTVTELALEAAGRHGLVYQPQHLMPGGEIRLPVNDQAGLVGSFEAARAPLRYLNERAGSIYAGSNEIQRNILAKILLTTPTR